LGNKAPDEKLPSNLRAYVAEFDGALTHEQYNDSRFSYRLLFNVQLDTGPPIGDCANPQTSPCADCSIDTHLTCHGRA